MLSMATYRFRSFEITRFCREVWRFLPSGIWRALLHSCICSGRKSCLFPPKILTGKVSLRSRWGWFWLLFGLTLWHAHMVNNISFTRKLLKTFDHWLNLIQHLTSAFLLGLTEDKKWINRGSCSPLAHSLVAPRNIPNNKAKLDRSFYWL